jgi:predicted ATPase
MRLDSQLIHLESSGLIRPASVEPEPEYLFRHALAQDAAYESLLKADRRILHRAVGEALERLYPDRRAELAPRLAAHFAEAGETARALDYFTLAAEQWIHLYTGLGNVTDDKGEPP